jgi:ADP-ribosyl-[dinitrogen reductase] hydrolase
METGSLRDAARGALLGAFAGDAIGATLEMLGRKPTSSEVTQAMMMVGGGAWRTAPGQVTDDGELTIALSRALANQLAYEPGRAAYYYRLWRLSSPFDVGMATGMALGQGDLNASSLVTDIFGNALSHNLASKANGSLMRASALGIWSINVRLDEAIEAAKLDAQLTHPNSACQWSGVAYVVAIRHLLLHPADAIGACAAAFQSLDTDDAVEVRAWLLEAQDNKLPSFYPNAGFVRIAFTNAFSHLFHPIDYESAIYKTLMNGGDTDTNACIAGGLVGALFGESGIPRRMIKAVVSCDTSVGRPRPKWLQTTQFEELLRGLLPTRVTDDDPSDAQ